MGRFFWIRRRTNEGRIESRREFSERLLRQLRDMVDDGEIGVAVAKRIISDMFEPEEAGAPRRVRLRVWQSYVKDRSGHIGPHLVDLNSLGSTGGSIGDEEPNED